MFRFDKNGPAFYSSQRAAEYAESHMFDKRECCHRDNPIDRRPVGWPTVDAEGTPLHWAAE